MTPTEFEFTLTMPGDSRLVGAIRQLTAHAAGYAQLSAEESEELAGQVADATEMAIAAANVEALPIEYRFSADSEALVVMFSCEVSGAARPPADVSSGGITVDWAADGTRHTCRIRQPLKPAPENLTTDA